MMDDHNELKDNEIEELFKLNSDLHHFLFKQHEALKLKGNMKYNLIINLEFSTNKDGIIEEYNGLGFTVPKIYLFDGAELP